MTKCDIGKREVKNIYILSNILFKWPKSETNDLVFRFREWSKIKRKTGMDRILMGHYSFFLENDRSSVISSQN